MEKDNLSIACSSEQASLDSNGSQEIRSGNGTLIVGSSHRLAGLFARDVEDEEGELPEGVDLNNDYDWLGVD